MPAAPAPHRSLAARAWSCLRAPGGQVLILRAFLGVTFVFAGLQKLASRAFFEASSPVSLQSQLAGSIPTSPIRPLLRLVAHAPIEFGVAIAVGEIAVGIGTLLGLYGRLAAAGGCALSASFFFSISWATTPYYYGSDIVFVFTWTVLIVGGAGPISLDARLSHHLGTSEAEGAASTLSRRRFVGRTGAVLAAGTATVLAAGLDALIGRAASARASGTTILTTLPPSTTSSTESGTGGSTPPTSSTLVRERVLAASQVPVGGGAAFTDPVQQIPAWARQLTAGDFVAFSAVCTHAGCTVNYSQVEDRFNCPCHGSVYNATTGAVINGPAPLPLPRIAITEEAGSLYVSD